MYVHITPSEMYSHFRSVEYPISKSELIDVAEGNGASLNVLEVLYEIRDGEYFSLPDLMQEIQDLEFRVEEEEYEEI